MQGRTGVEIREVLHDVLDVLLGRQNGGSAPPAPTDTPLVPVTRCPTFAGLLKPHAPLVQVCCDFEPAARHQPSLQYCTAARHVDMSPLQIRQHGQSAMHLLRCPFRAGTACFTATVVPAGAMCCRLQQADLLQDGDSNDTELASVR